MKRASPRKWRLEFVYALLALCLVGLGVRLYWLQANLGPRAEQMIRRQQVMTIPTAGRPGLIFLRSGTGNVVLAGSRPIRSVYVDPDLIDEPDLAPTAIRLGKALGMTEVRVQELIFLRRERRFAWIKRGVSDQEADAVRALRLPWAGVTYEWKREYPNGPLAAAVVGFPPADPNSPSGMGVELQQRRVLAATDGRLVQMADASRRPLTAVASECVAPQDGLNVLLCIDAAIQEQLEKTLAETVEKFSGKWGSAIVVNPQTGEVLAMCSTPSFNPNDYAHATPEQYTNKTITVPFEPGSVAKPIFAAAAVQAGVVTYNTMIYCENGVYRAPRGGTISDHGNHYGFLSVHDILVHSSNIGMAKVGEKLGNRQLYEWARRFGLGEKTGIDLPGESGGILRDLRKWDGYSLRRVPFGQEVSTTTIQLAMAFSALVNGGELLRPRVADRIVDGSGRTVREFPRTVVRRVISRSVSDQTLSAMTDVVERGTGSGGKLSRWTSFGKTGTAQIPGPGGYSPNAYVASFVGGAPARSPKVLCLISIYWPTRNGYYGGKVAAPAVKEVLEHALMYLDVPSDRATAVASAD